jgi:uncharacterized membrane protein
MLDGRVELRPYPKCGKPSDDKAAEGEINRPLRNVEAKSMVWRQFKPRDISLTVVFASLYAICVITLAPISFDVWQVRVADALLPLSMIFGIPCALGLSLGCLVANIFAPSPHIIDIFGGAFANLAACLAACWIGRGGKTLKRFLGTVVETAIITAIVGGYLSITIGIALEASMLGIFIGSVIAVNMLGFTLEETVRRILPKHYLP